MDDEKFTYKNKSRFCQTAGAAAAEGPEMADQPSWLLKKIGSKSGQSLDSENFQNANATQIGPPPFEGVCYVEKTPSPKRSVEDYKESEE